MNIGNLGKYQDFVGNIRVIAAVFLHGTGYGMCLHLNLTDRQCQRNV